MDLRSVKGLFNKQKDDPLFLERQKKTRNALLKNLSRAVKEVQLMYTRTQDGVIGDCRPVQRLCARFEDVLRNELKAGWLGKSGRAPTFWPVVLKISRKQAVEYINRLQYAQTDNGRCRAWIRLAANECSLESYINVLCQDSSLLNQYYEAHSFLRDEDTVMAMKQLLTGVSQISFNITVDTASLEFAPAPEALQPALRIRAPLQMESISNGDTSGPSSTSTPQASSSESSWRSNSSSSSSTHHSIRDGGISVREKLKVDNNVEVVQMGQGLEASVRQEDDSLVIEAPGLTKVSAYSNLKRFSLAMEDTNDDWMMHDDKDEEQDKMVPGVNIGSVNTGGIFMKIREQQEEDQLREAQVLVDEQVVTVDPGDTGLTAEPPPSQVTPSQVTPSHASSSHVTPSHMSRSSPPHEQKRSSSFTPPPSQEVLTVQNSSSSDSLSTTRTNSSQEPKLRSPSHSSQIPSESYAALGQLNENPLPVDMPAITDEPNHASDPNLPPKSPEKTSQEEHKVEEIPEEYSFNEILRLATGVKSSSSSSRSVSVDREDKADLPMRRGSEQGSTRSPLIMEKPSELEDPYATIDEDQATPKVEVNTNNPFLSSPTTPIAHSTNPFADNYKEPESPSSHHPAAVVATFGNPFEASSTFGSELTSNSQTGEAFKFGISPHPFTDQDVDSRSPPAGNLLNPFDQPEVEDTKTSPHFGDKGEQKQLTNDSKNPVNSKQASVNQDSSILSSVLSLSVEALAKVVLTENYYSNEMSVEEIDVKVSKLKVYLKNDSSNTDLQQALIQLQLLKQTKLEAEEEVSLLKGEVIFGHTFQEVRWGIKGKKCDICNKPSLLKKLYQCAFCGQLSHVKCLGAITRKCVFQALKDRSDYIMEIRPEKGLTHQHFRCDCCNRALNTSVEVRLCDYTGLYYCPECHHNDLSLIPARMMHDWDFDQRVVCCGCAEVLSALETRPLINIRSINPSLYKFIPDIPGVEALRQEILLMKPLLVDCDRAKEEKLLQELDPWPHFKDSANMYSVKDLIGLQCGTLLPKVQAVHKMYLSHVNDECENCLSLGKVCCVCRSPEKLFKFSKDVAHCQKCLAVFHKNCFPKSNNCPVCAKNRKSIFSTMFH